MKNKKDEQKQQSAIMNIKKVICELIHGKDMFFACLLLLLLSLAFLFIFNGNVMLHFFFFHSYL